MDNMCESLIGRWEAVLASRHVDRLPWSGYNCNVEVFKGHYKHYYMTVVFIKLYPFIPR